MKKTRNLLATGLTLGLVMALQGGCAGTAKVTQPTATPETSSQGAAEPDAVSEISSLSGKVVETMNAGGYTYVCLEKNGQKSWAAMTSASKVVVGDELALKPGMVMHNFNSKALNRTFDKIVFTDGPANQPTADEAAKVKRHGELSEQIATTGSSGKLSGKVVETMDSGGYTYVNLEKDGKTTWVALPVTKVSVGQEIEVRPGMQMGKFTSKTLNKTFDEIVFSSGLMTDSKTPLPSGHPPMGAKPESDKGKPASDVKTQPKGHMGMMAQPGKEMTEVSGKVVETMDSGGYTYICLENGGKKLWAAVPSTKVSVGQELKLQPGVEMINFKSSSLNRTFDSVIFSGGVLPAP